MPACALSSLIAAVCAIPAGAARPEPTDMLTVWASVPDPRRARGVRYRFASILAVAVCAVLAGSRSYVAIATSG